MNHRPDRVVSHRFLSRETGSETAQLPPVSCLWKPLETGETGQQFPPRTIGFRLLKPVIKNIGFFIAGKNRAVSLPLKPVKNTAKRSRFFVPPMLSESQYQGVCRITTIMAARMICKLHIIKELFCYPENGIIMSRYARILSRFTPIISLFYACFIPNMAFYGGYNPHACL